MSTPDERDHLPSGSDFLSWRDTSSGARAEIHCEQIVANSSGRMLFPVYGRQEFDVQDPQEYVVVLQSGV